MDAIRVHLLGGVRIEGGPSGQTPDHLTKALQGLLGFLVLNHHRRHPREVLYTHFWGDQPEGRARRCLNTAFWRLRQVLEPAGTARGTFLVATAEGEIGVNWGPHIWLDTVAMEQAAARLATAATDPLSMADLQQLDHTLTASGELLEGFYEEWVLEARERFRIIQLRALADLATAYRVAGDHRRCMMTADRVLALDPLHEAIVRESMRAAVAGGNRGHALKRYSELRRVLRADLGTTPMPETDALYHQIAGRSLPAAESAPTGDGPVAGVLRDLHRIRRRLLRTIRALEQPGASDPDPPR